MGHEGAGEPMNQYDKRHFFFSHALQKINRQGADVPVDDVPWSSGDDVPWNDALWSSGDDAPWNDVPWNHDDVPWNHDDAP